MEQKATTLHMIGHAHIDPVWLWQWQEGLHEVRATFRSALERMKESNIVFTASSAAFYEWVEKSDPAMFEEIKQRVAEGRWEFVGWWVEPDCNLPCGESFVRHGLYSQRYYKDKFGRIASVGFNPDSFGHNAMLPQILCKCGMKYYVFMRPGPSEKSLPGPLFWWEADDGSRVLAFRIAYAYLSWAGELDEHVRRCAAEMKAPLDEFMCFYGVGDHGGGPTRENIASIERLRAAPDLPALEYSSVSRFFESVAAKNLRLPVVHDELQHHASGCYAAHSGIKRWNRRAENLLLAAERWSAIASWVTGQPYPDDLAHAWKTMLFHQFHDILAGTSLEAAYEDARNAYGETMSIAGRALNDAIQAIAWHIGIASAKSVRPIVVFNPHAWPCRRNIEMELGGLRGDHVVVDEGDRPVALQFVQPRATARRSRISFIADLPALGYRVYRLVPGKPADMPPVAAGEGLLENDRLRLELDPQTGYIARLYDKSRQVNVFAGPAARPVVIDDPSDTWSHNVFRFDRVIGAFSAQAMYVVEQGPVKAVLRVESSYGQSRLVQTFTMYRDLDQIDVHVHVDWHERHKMLKLRFPVNLQFAKATYEIPYGHIERPANGEEEPGQSWIDMSGVSRDTGTLYGLSILNDGKYSFDVENQDIGLTVLRSPIYAHHIPDAPVPGRPYSYMDQGPQEFTYSLLPHAGSWEHAGTVERAAELNQQPIALFATFHEKGILPQRGSFVAVDRDNIIVNIVKKAEDSNDLVLRCYETTKTATRAIIALPFWQRTFSADFAPCEIKTFLVPKDAWRPVVETNMLEGVE